MQSVFYFVISLVSILLSFMFFVDNGENGKKMRYIRGVKKEYFKNGWKVGERKINFCCSLFFWSYQQYKIWVFFILIWKYKLLNHFLGQRSNNVLTQIWLSVLCNSFCKFTLAWRKRDKICSHESKLQICMLNGNTNQKVMYMAHKIMQLLCGIASEI